MLLVYEAISYLHAQSRSPQQAYARHTLHIRFACATHTLQLEHLLRAAYAEEFAAAPRHSSDTRAMRYADSRTARRG